MDLALTLAVVAGLAVALPLVILAEYARRRRYGRIAVSRRVLVNLDDGSAIEGVLWQERKPLIVLRNARLHTGGQEAPLDGEVVIDCARVAFVQVVS